jgi:hypothetical protein
MAGRGKPQQKIVIACARELAGFVWAIATDQPPRNTLTITSRPRAADAPTTRRTFEASMRQRPSR